VTRPSVQRLTRTIVTAPEPAKSLCWRRTYCAVRGGHTDRRVFSFDALIILTPCPAVNVTRWPRRGPCAHGGVDVDGGAGRDGVVGGEMRPGLTPGRCPDWPAAPIVTQPFRAADLAGHLPRSKLLRDGTFVGHAAACNVDRLLNNGTQGARCDAPELREEAVLAGARRWRRSSPAETRTLLVETSDDPTSRAAVSCSPRRQPRRRCRRQSALTRTSCPAVALSAAPVRPFNTGPLDGHCLSRR
jgi:hypothetical protein